METLEETQTQELVQDREITRELLDDVVNFLSKNEENHKVVGLTAAKYVETLQRSNEQLVKVAAIIQKNQTSSAGLSDLDKNELFDMIGSAKDVGS